MAFKVFNKYRKPKYTEFSRKDLVVDIKNGHLYFKSNIGVHKVGSFIDTNQFGQVPTTIQPTSEFEWISVTGWALIANLSVFGTASLAGANNYIGGTWNDITNTQGGVTTQWTPNCSDKIYLGGQVTASCDITSSGFLSINTNTNSDPNYKVLVIDPATGRIFRTGSYGGGGAGAGGGGDITAVNITAGSGLLGTQNTATGDHNQTLSIVEGTGINVLANGIEVDVSDFMANGTDNFVLTATGTDTFQAEEGLQYDSDINALTLSGSLTASTDISASGLLYISASHTASIFENVAIYDSASGRLYYTSSAGLSAQLDTFKTTGQRSGSAAITGSLYIDSHITASGNISASGTIFANNFQSTGGDVNGILFNDHLLITGSITSSGNISSSGTILANEANIAGNITASGDVSASGLLFASASLGSFPNVAVYHSESGRFYYTSSQGLLGATFKQTGKREGDSEITGSLTLSGSGNTSLIIQGNITSSENISASGDLLINNITSSGNITASGFLFISASEDSTTSYKTLVYDTATGRVYHTGSYGGSGGGIGFPYSGSDSLTNNPAQAVITGSLFLSGSGHITASGTISASGGFTGSLFGTSSFSTTSSFAISSSYAVTASHALNAASASFAVTSSHALNAVSASFAITSSHALTASFIDSTLLDTFKQTGQRNGDAAITGSLTLTNLTASNNVSASGFLFASASEGNYSNIVVHDSTTGRFYVTSSAGLSAGLETFKETGQRNGDSAITGSLIVGNITSSGIISASGGFTGSLFGTSSFAITASFVESASFATTASFVESASFATTASFVESASFATTASFVESSSFATTASFVESASFATTASFVESASFATTASFVESASFATTASFVESASFATTASFVESASFATTASFVESASFATTASFVESASFATTASFVESASFATTASFVESASFATTSSFTISSSYAVTASHALNAVSSSYALTSSHAITASYVDVDDLVIDTFKSTGQRNGDAAITGSLTLTNLTASGEITSSNYFVNTGDIIPGTSQGYFFDINKNSGLTHNAANDMFIQHLLNGKFVRFTGKNPAGATQIGATIDYGNTNVILGDLTTPFTVTASSHLFVKGNVSASEDFIGISGSLDYVETTGNISASGLLFASSSQDTASAFSNFIVVHDTSSGRFYTSEFTSLSTLWKRNPSNPTSEIYWHQEGNDAPKIAVGVIDPQEVIHAQFPIGILGKGPTPHHTDSASILVSSSGQTTLKFHTQKVSESAPTAFRGEQKYQLGASSYHFHPTFPGAFFIQDETSNTVPFKILSGSNNKTLTISSSNVGIGNDLKGTTNTLRVSGSTSSDLYVFGSGSIGGLPPDKPITGFFTASNASNLITGSATSVFLSEVRKGDAFKVTSASISQVFTVTQVFNNSRLTLDSNWTGNTYTQSLGHVNSDLFRIINGDDKVRFTIDKTGNIRGTGLLFASSSTTSSLTNIVLQDTSSGRFYTTSSAGLSGLLNSTLDTFKQTGIRSGSNKSGESDSTKIIGALEISQSLAPAMGPGTNRHATLVLHRSNGNPTIKAGSDGALNATGYMIIDSSGSGAGNGAVQLNAFIDDPVWLARGGGSVVVGRMAGIAQNNPDARLQVQGNIWASGSGPSPFNPNPFGLTGNITASGPIGTGGNITASGFLFASASEGNYSAIVVHDSSSGRFYTTSSAGFSAGLETFKITGQRSGSAAITGSLIVGNITSSGTISASGGFTGSLFGTSSFATTASFVASSSFTTTASFAISSSFTITSSYSISSSYAITSSYSISSSHALNAISSSYAVTASYVDFNDISGIDTFKSTGQRNGDAGITGSLDVTNRISASGHLFASSSEDTNGFKLVTVDTGSGQFFYSQTIDEAQIAGPQGAKGEKGSKGEKGAQGTAGAKGQKGEAGAKGQKGEAGAKGSTGAKGQKGEVGSKGSTGAKGAQGNSGSTGAKGQKGQTGVGIQGAKGAQGNTALDGAKGQKGSGGAKGSAGQKGSKGQKGQTGLGSKGQKGQQGAAVQGAKGQKGQQGASIQGTQGAKGQKGSTGQKGQQGTSVQGSKGQKGQTGGNGSQGAKGQKGQTGGSGSQGAKGQKGQTGGSGSQGAKGQKGQTGVGQKGQKGSKGQKGQTGQKGSKGQKGQTGQKGSKGQKGQTGQKGQKGQTGQKGQKGEVGPSVATTTTAEINAETAGDRLFDAAQFGASDYKHTVEFNMTGNVDGGTDPTVTDNTGGKAVFDFKGGTGILLDGDNTNEEVIWRFFPNGSAGNVLFTNGTYLSTPTNNLNFDGTDFSCGGDIIAFASDKRLKENIVNIEKPLEKIKQLNGVYYDWKDKALDLGLGITRQYNEIGLIAQELEKVIPQAVTRAPFDNIDNEEIYVSGSRIDGETDPYKTIKIERVIPLLIEGIKEQQKQIELLKNKINKI